MVRRSVARVLLASVAAGLIAVALFAPGATARQTKQGCLKRTNNQYGKLRECVTLEGVRAHQAAFQAIATANGGNRAAGTSGYDASVDYVVKKLEAAGWDVEHQPVRLQGRAAGPAAHAGGRHARGRAA